MQSKLKQLEILQKINDLQILKKKVILKSELKNPTPERSNVNYIFLRKCLEEKKSGAVLEGSSRSGKTYSWVDFVIYICLHVEKSCTINIYRQTYAEFKTTIYDDFKRRLSDFDLDNPFDRLQEVKMFKIGKNKINLIGCDNPSAKHGASCDYAIFNEGMFIPQEVFDQVEQRCRKFWIKDYNPSFTQHWVFDKILKRPDVGFLRSTFRENRFISERERNKILRYEPWEIGSYEVIDNNIIYNGKIVDEYNQPPIHKVNYANGTVDEFMWRVYGLGLRGAMAGVIFPNVTYIDKFPVDIAPTYGNDFGFVSDPNVTVKYGKLGNNIYLEPLIYQPIATSNELSESFKAVRISKYDPITADSSDRYVSEQNGVVQMVSELFEMGWEISKVSKNKSVVYWLMDMKKYKIHIVNNDITEKYVKKEQENYKWKEVNGILINQPIDAFNHFWDASRYAHMADDGNSFDTEMY